MKTAFNKYNPDDLLAQLVDLLLKHGLEEPATELQKLTPKIQKAWRTREASAAAVMARHLATRSNE